MWDRLFLHFHPSLKDSLPTAGKWEADFLLMVSFVSKSIKKKALGKVDKTFLDATNQNTFCVTSAVSGKSKFYQAHKPNSCTWFIVNFGELWQVAVVTEKKQSTERCREKRLSSELIYS